MIKAILFDLDGVLVDAVDWHARALNQSLSLFGYALGSKEHDKDYNGLPTLTKLEILTARHGFPKSLHPFVSEMKQNYTRRILEGNCAADTKVTAMLRNLKARGYHLAVASNCIRNTVELVLGKMAITEYFDVILSREDVKSAKPSPEIYQECLRRLRCEPSECLIVEDSEPGMKAARATSDQVLRVQNAKELTLEKVLVAVKSFENSPTPHPSEKIDLEIVVPMAGLGQRFHAAGYASAKPFIDVLGRPMISWVIENIRPASKRAHFTFIVNDEAYKNHGVTVLKDLVPDCSIVRVKNVTEGAACTVLLATDALSLGRPLLLANSDQWVDVKIDDFLKTARETNADGLIMTFPASEKKWSYAKVNERNHVIQVAEKNPISSHATVGIYYFKRALDFVEGAQNMIRQDQRTNGEFYVCPVYNQLIQKNKDIRIHEIPAAKMHGLGTPEDLRAFLQWKNELQSSPYVSGADRETEDQPLKLSA